jgi:hypothetical protein
MTKPQMPAELAAILENAENSVRIPIHWPNPVTEEDAERLYSLTDECTLGSDPEGDYASVVEDAEAVHRVLYALREAGFRTVFHRPPADEEWRQLVDRIDELSERVSALEASKSLGS